MEKSRFDKGPAGRGTKTVSGFGKGAVLWKGLWAIRVGLKTGQRRGDAEEALSRCAEEAGLMSPAFLHHG